MGTRRLRRVVAGCALAAVVATGWGTPAAALSRASVSAKEWVADVCSATRTWARDVGRAAAKAQESYADRALVAGPLPELLTYLGVAAVATGTFTAAAEDVGVPDVRGGRDAARTLVQTLDAIETGFRDARRDLLPLRASTDPAAIAAGVAIARARLDDTVTTGLGALNGVLGSGALARAAPRVRACRALSG